MIIDKIIKNYLKFKLMKLYFHRWGGRRGRGLPGEAHLGRGRLCNIPDLLLDQDAAHSRSRHADRIEGRLDSDAHLPVPLGRHGALVEIEELLARDKLRAGAVRCGAARGRLHRLLRCFAPLVPL